MEERNISEDKEFIDKLDKAVHKQMSGKSNDNNSFDLIDYVYSAIKDYYIGIETDSSKEQQTSPCFGDKDFGNDFFEMIKQDICLELLYRRMTKPLEDICSEMEDGKPYNLISTLQDKYDPMLFEYPTFSFYVDIYGKLSDETIKTVPNMYRSNHKFHTINDLISLHDYLRTSSQKYIATKEDYSIMQAVNECYMERTYNFFIKQHLYLYFSSTLKEIIKDKIAPYNVFAKLGKDGIIGYKEKSQSAGVTLRKIDETIDASKEKAINVLIYGFIKKDDFPFWANITFKELQVHFPYLSDEFYNLFCKAIKRYKLGKYFKKKDKNPLLPLAGYPRFIVNLVDYIVTAISDDILIIGCGDNRAIFSNMDNRLAVTIQYQNILQKIIKLKLSTDNDNKFSDEEKKFLFCFANTEIPKISASDIKHHITYIEYLNMFDKAIDQCLNTVSDENISVPQNINNYIRIFTKAVTDSLNYYLDEIKTQKRLLQHSQIQTIQDLNRYINSYNTYSESMEFAQQCATYEFVITRSYFFKKYMDEKYAISFITNTNYIKSAGLMMATVNKIYSSTLEVIVKYAKKYKISLDEEYLKDRSYNLISIVDISEDETSNTEDKTDNTEDETKNVDFVPLHIQNLIVYDITTKPRPYFIPFFSKDHSEPTAILGTPLGTPVPETL